MNEKVINLIKSCTTYVWLGIIAAFWYKVLLFRCIGDISRSLSTIILIGLIVVCSLLGITIQWALKRKEITFFNVFADVIVGYGIYTVFSYYRICTMLILIVLFLSFAFVVVNAFSICARRIDKKKVSKKIILKRRIRLINGTKGIACVAFMLIMGYISINSFFGISLVKSTVSPSKPYDVETQTIANNYETLCLLKDDAWAGLSLEERLGVLQTVANIEQRYLGLSHELNVGTKTLEEGVLGCYDESEHLILISVDCLLNESSHKCVEVTCHECRHAYQIALTYAYQSLDAKYRTLLLFTDVQSYEMEFCNYIDADDDIYGYISQRCESDAYLYGLIAADDYFQRINEYPESN